MQRSRDRTSDEHERYVTEVEAREHDSRTKMEAAIRERVNMEVERENLQGRVHTLTEELGKARERVKIVERDNSNKEMRITELLHGKTEEDKDRTNLVVALEAKQQELDEVRLLSQNSFML